MGCLPNIVIMAPSDELELMNMIQTAYGIDDMPSVVRYPRGTVSRVTQPETQLKPSESKHHTPRFTLHARITPPHPSTPRPSHAPRRSAPLPAPLRTSRPSRCTVVCCQPSAQQPSAQQPSARHAAGPGCRQAAPAARLARAPPLLPVRGGAQGQAAGRLL